MNKLHELIAEKGRRADRAKALADIIQGDPAKGIAGRDLTDTEQAELTTLRTTADTLDTQIRNAEWMEAEARSAASAAAQRMFHTSVPSGQAEAREMADIQKKYSITRAVQYAANKSVDAGLEKEQHEEAMRQARESNLPVTGNGILLPGWTTTARATAGTALDAGNLIATNQMSTIDGYRKRLFVGTLGATMHMGLTGDATLPIADLLATSAFVGETDAFTAITSNVRKPTLQAKGLLSKLNVSWFLKARAGAEADSVLSRTLETSSVNALNLNIIKRANSNSSHGIFGASDIIDVSGTDGSELTRDMLISMINSPEKNDAGGDSAGWIVSPAVREELQKTFTDAGSGLFVWPADVVDRLLGYNAAVTTLMPSNLEKGDGTDLYGIAYGHWSNLHIANWAIREMIIDPASSDTGVVLKLVEFWDWAFANPKAFSVGYYTLASESVS